MVNFLVFIIALLSSIVTYWQSGRILPLIDYAYQVENAYRIFIGEVPYRDFFLVLPPGTYAYMALIMKVFGLSNLIQISFLMIFSFFTVILTFSILKHINKNRITNIVLLLPLIFAGYAIYPFPSYDMSATLCMLLGWMLIWNVYENKNSSPFKYVFIGFTLTLPSFFKQNTGYIYTVSMLMLVLYEIYTSKINVRKKTILFLVGYILPIVMFILYLLYTQSFKQYIFQTITFPARARNIVASSRVILLDVFNKRNLILYSSVLLAYIISVRKKLLVKYKEVMMFMLLAVSTILFPIVYLFQIIRRYVNKEFFFYFEYIAKYYFSIWYLVIGILAFYIIKRLYSKNLRERKPVFSLIFSVEIIAICLVSFLSQGVNGSTYGIYPLFVIILSLILVETNLYIKGISWSKFIMYISILMTCVLSIYVFYNVRLQYFSRTGTYTRASLPGMEHLATRGPWIKEMEDMIEWAKSNCPRSESVVSIPGEDPIYFLLRRKPPLPYFQYLSSTYPFSGKEYAKTIVSNNIKWVIVKTHTQNVDWKKTDDLLLYISQRYALYQRIQGYNIYRRK